MRSIPNKVIQFTVDVTANVEISFVRHGSYSICIKIPDQVGNDESEDGLPRRLRLLAMTFPFYIPNRFVASFTMVSFSSGLLSAMRSVRATSVPSAIFFEPSAL